MCKDPLGGEVGAECGWWSGHCEAPGCITSLGDVGSPWREAPWEVPMQLEEEKGLSVLGHAPSTKVLEHVNPSLS